MRNIFCHEPDFFFSNLRQLSDQSILFFGSRDTISHIFSLYKLYCSSSYLLSKPSTVDHSDSDSDAMLCDSGNFVLEAVADIQLSNRYDSVILVHPESYLFEQEKKFVFVGTDRIDDQLSKSHYEKKLQPIVYIIGPSMSGRTSTAVYIGSQFLELQPNTRSQKSNNNNMSLRRWIVLVDYKTQNNWSPDPKQRTKQAIEIANCKIISQIPGSVPEVWKQALNKLKHSEQEEGEEEELENGKDSAKDSVCVVLDNFEYLLQGIKEETEIESFLQQFNSFWDDVVKNIKQWKVIIVLDSTALICFVEIFNRAMKRFNGRYEVVDVDKTPNTEFEMKDCELLNRFYYKTPKVIVKEMMKQILRVLRYVSCAMLSRLLREAERRKKTSKCCVGREQSEGIVKAVLEDFIEENLNRRRHSLEMFCEGDQDKKERWYLRFVEQQVFRVAKKGGSQWRNCIYVKSEEGRIHFKDPFIYLLLSILCSEQ